MVMLGGASIGYSGEDGQLAGLATSILGRLWFGRRMQVNFNSL